MENFKPTQPTKEERECPYESRRVVCDSCGGPYNIDSGCITKGNKVFGGCCDDCGHTIGKKINVHSRSVLS